MTLSRASRLLALPASVTVLASLTLQPPTWTLGPLAQKPEVTTPAVVKQPKPKPIPRIVAVDKRIARRVNTLRPSVKRRLLAAVRRLPKKVTLLVTSARRTRQEQASLRGTFGVKARAGKSTHEDGRAIDVNVLVNGERVSPRRQQKIIGKAMASAGFRYLGAIDPVHYSIPVHAVDAVEQRGPLLEVMTWNEMIDLQAEHEAYAGTMVADAGTPAAAGSDGATAAF